MKIPAPGAPLSPVKGQRADAAWPLNNKHHRHHAITFQGKDEAFGMTMRKRCFFHLHESIRKWWKDERNHQVLIYIYMYIIFNNYYSLDFAKITLYTLCSVCSLFGRVFVGLNLSCKTHNFHKSHWCNDSPGASKPCWRQWWLMQWILDKYPPGSWAKDSRHTSSISQVFFFVSVGKVFGVWYTYHWGFRPLDFLDLATARRTIPIRTNSYVYTYIYLYI